MYFTKRGLNQLQENISNKLHDHSFFNIIFDMAFDSHHARLRSCASLGMGASLFIRPNIPPFCLPFDVFLLPCAPIH
jgi:hypothetical protein